MKLLQESRHTRCPLSVGSPWCEVTAGLPLCPLPWTVFQFLRHLGQVCVFSSLSPGFCRIFIPSRSEVTRTTVVWVFPQGFQQMPLDSGLFLQSPLYICLPFLPALFRLQHQRRRRQLYRVCLVTLHKVLLLWQNPDLNNWPKFGAGPTGTSGEVQFSTHWVLMRLAFRAQGRF